jgi:hypothetical protein
MVMSCKQERKELSNSASSITSSSYAAEHELFKYPSMRIIIMSANGNSPHLPSATKHKKRD